MDCTCLLSRLKTRYLWHPIGDEKGIMMHASNRTNETIWLGSSKRTMVFRCLLHCLKNNGELLVRIVIREAPCVGKYYFVARVVGSQVVYEVHLLSLYDSTPAIQACWRVHALHSSKRGLSPWGSVSFYINAGLLFEKKHTLFQCLLSLIRTMIWMRRMKSIRIYLFPPPFLKLQLPSVDFDRRCVNAVRLYRMGCGNIRWYFEITSIGIDFMPSEKT